MRGELRGVRERGEPLANWKRRFILSDELNPCRASVIQHNILRGNYADSWFFPRMLKMSDLVTRANRDACDEFCQSLAFVRDRQFTQPAQQHDVCHDVTIARVVEDLLLHYRVEDPTDTESTLGMLLQLSQALKANPHESACMYRMRPDYESSRGLDDQGKISSIRRLHQGPTRSGGGYSYPGDHEFRDANRVTVQLHVINLTEKDQAPNDVVVLRSVPVLAVWIPNRMSLHWIVQDQASRT
jgi:hypothetical protein